MTFSPDRECSLRATQSSNSIPLVSLTAMPLHDLSRRPATVEARTRHLHPHCPQEDREALRQLLLQVIDEALQLVEDPINGSCIEISAANRQ